jgi:lipopolysaccharide biosynthesis glycosyltransferase
MKVYLGWDNREQDAYAVAAHSLFKHASIPIELTALKSDRLAESGLLRRPTDRRGQIYDLPSNAPASTEFAISRFLTPVLAQEGWALFADADVVFLGDVAELLTIADPSKAVQVVKHDMGAVGGKKMDGQAQVAYSRKNWSSVMLFNASHRANRRLSLQDVNERPGRDLHGFYWLHDDEIGELPPEWNWLVGCQDKPANPKIAHYTLGVPSMVADSPHAEIWWDAYRSANGNDRPR